MCVVCVHVCRSACVRLSAWAVVRRAGAESNRVAGCTRHFGAHLHRKARPPDVFSACSRTHRQITVRVQEKWKYYTLHIVGFRVEAAASSLLFYFSEVTGQADFRVVVSLTAKIKSLTRWVDAFFEGKNLKSSFFLNSVLIHGLFGDVGAVVYPLLTPFCSRRLTYGHAMLDFLNFDLNKSRCLNRLST